MYNYHFLHRSTSSYGQRPPTWMRQIRLVILFSVLLTVLGTLALAYTLAQVQPPPLTHTSRPHTASPLARHSFTVPQLPSSPALPLNSPLFHGNLRLPEVALTFDDGPLPSSTPHILTILQRFGIQATFFCIGQQVQDYPALVRQEQADGDLVEDHTWSHPNLTYLPTPLLDRQIEMTAQAISHVTGTPPLFLRPPYGAINATVLTQAQRLNLSLVLWNVDPRDWSLPGSSTIIGRVLSSTQNGSIILLHDGGGNRAQTIAALPSIITALRTRGLRFVTIQQLIDDLPRSL
jgi:peptidoglycan/xylan/chitin deacetylase (PgdA/CDA1 family)